MPQGRVEEDSSVFPELFQSLGRALQGVDAVNCSGVAGVQADGGGTEGGPEAGGEGADILLLRQMAARQPRLYAALRRDEWQRTMLTLDRVRAAKAQAALRRQYEIGTQRRAIEYSTQRVRYLSSLAQAQIDVAMKRVLHQESNSSRRLRELVFECLGEYGKTTQRSASRSAYMQARTEQEIRENVQALRWARFAARMEEDLRGAAHCVDVSPVAHEQVFQRAGAVAAQVLHPQHRQSPPQKQPPPDGQQQRQQQQQQQQQQEQQQQHQLQQERFKKHIKRIVVIYSAQGAPSGTTRASGPIRRMPELFECLIRACAPLRSRVHPLPTSTQQCIPRPVSSVPPRALVTAKCLEWLHPPSFCAAVSPGPPAVNRGETLDVKSYVGLHISSLAQGCVYWCIEERAAAQLRSHAPPAWTSVGHSSVDGMAAGDGTGAASTCPSTPPSWRADIEFACRQAAALEAWCCASQQRRGGVTFDEDDVESVVDKPGGHRPPSVANMAAAVASVAASVDERMQAVKRGAATPPVVTGRSREFHHASPQELAQGLPPVIVGSILATAGTSSSSAEAAQGEAINFHLAAASVASLMEHPAFHNYMTRLAAPAERKAWRQTLCADDTEGDTPGGGPAASALLAPRLPRLYVLVKPSLARGADAKPPGPDEGIDAHRGAYIVPLAETCMRELLRVYLFHSMPSLRTFDVQLAGPAQQQQQQQQQAAPSREESAALDSTEVEAKEADSPGTSRPTGPFSASGRDAAEHWGRLACCCLDVLPDRDYERFDRAHGEVGGSLNGVDDSGSATGGLTHDYYVVRFPSLHRNLGGAATGSDVGGGDSAAAAAAAAATAAAANDDDADEIDPHSLLASSYPPLAMLVQVDREQPADTHLTLVTTSHAAGANSALSTSKKPKWDPTVLSSLCRWRACCLLATPSPPPKTLCTFHAQVKKLVDEKGHNESANFLVRKTPPTLEALLEMAAAFNAHPSARAAGIDWTELNDTELLMTVSASGLLQELWNGKLADTIRTFCKRVVAECSPKHRYALRMKRRNAGKS